eukprot:5657760-Alexandrium_andersonii.AAC.1
MRAARVAPPSSPPILGARKRRPAQARNGRRPPARLASACGRRPRAHQLLHILLKNLPPRLPSLDCTPNTNES